MRELEFLIFILGIAIFVAPVLSVILLVRTGRHADRIEFCKGSITRLRKELSTQEERITRLFRTLTEAGISIQDLEQPLAGQPESIAPEPSAAAPAVMKTCPAELVMAVAAIPATPPAETVEQSRLPPQTEAPALLDTFTRFIKGGNLWVAGGVVLLLIAFGFLFTYIAQRGFFTVEMRIAAAIICGLAMLVFGWRFRLRKPVYALVIQGGGIGVLYLSFFAAAKLTGLLPLPAALALNTLLVPGTITLALLQNSQALAVFGLLGGFAAPILLSSGSGNYIALFSYYTILDLAVVFISRRRLWRVLTLTAAVCTFATALAWIGNSYEPAMFATAEPFMLGFILIFTFLGIQSARTTQISLENYVDIPLTIGTPFLGALTQWQLFSYIDHGFAIVCIAFSAFYLFLTWLIWKKSGVSLRALAEGYLGLSVLLANIAIPLELSPRVTSAIWAAEGALIFAFGCRLASRRLRAAGIVIHIAAAITFFVEIGGYLAYGYAELPAFRNPVFTGGLVIALTAFLTAIFSARGAADETPPSGPRFALSAAFSVWGFLWWLITWGVEFDRLAGYSTLVRPTGLFICASLTALAAYGAARLFRCPALHLGLAAPVLLALLVITRLLGDQLSDHLQWGKSALDILTCNFFQGNFLWAWLLFFASSAFLLWHARAIRSSATKEWTARLTSGRVLPRRVHALWLAFVIFIAVTVFTCTGRAYTEIWDLARSWKSLAGVLPAFACVVLVSRFARPLTDMGRAYRLALVVWIPRILCAAVGVWFTGTLFALGDPAPLPYYIPLLNPLELQQAFCIVLVIFRQLSLRRAGVLPAWKPQTLFVVADLMV
ncbi:MAG: DUF2339 domain-containing protein, partial [Spirochaetaceae bacterium]|nr:DUF2339 domain-containing protein [Spirochaetaceae bacterium]